MGSYIDIEISIEFPLKLSFLDTYLFISSVVLACYLTIKQYFVYILNLEYIDVHIDMAINYTNDIDIQ